MKDNEEFKKELTEKLINAHIELKKTEKHILFQNEEKEKRAAELVIAYSELKETEKHLQEHILGLEEMMFMTSHRVRQPIAHILGISNLLDESICSLEEIIKMVGYLKQSAQSLDSFTIELTEFMSALKQK